MEDPTDREKAATNVNLVTGYHSAPGDYDRNAIDAAILFADLVNSTAYKQHNGPIQGMVKTYRHNRIAAENISKSPSGKVIKFLGDGVMAIFRGATGARDAIAAGLSIIEEIDCANQSLDFPHTITTRIGVNYGKVSLFDYPQFTALDPQGLTVDIAARLCDLADGQQLICTSDTYAIAGAEGAFPGAGEEIERFLKGINHPIKLREVPNKERKPKGLRLAGHARPVHEAVDAKLKQANELLRREDFQRALQIYQEVIAQDPGNFISNYRIAEILVSVSFEHDNEKRKRELATALKHLCFAKEVRPEAGRVWLKMAWLHFKRYELLGESKLLLEAIERASKALKSCSDFLDVEGANLARTRLAWFLLRRAVDSKDSTNRHKDLVQAEAYCKEIENSNDHFAELNRSEYLLTYAWVMIEKGDASSRQDEIRDKIARAKDLCPSSTRVFDVEKRLVEVLNDGRDGGQPIVPL